MTKAKVGVPWTWGKESRGQKPKSLEKVSKKSPGAGVPKVRKKSRKRSEKSKKSLKMGFWRLFGPFSRLFSDFWGPGPGDFFETFLRLFGFWPRDSFSQVHGTSKPRRKDISGNSLRNAEGSRNPWVIKFHGRLGC